MRTIICAVLFATALTGCNGKPDPAPTAVETTANGYQVVKLFEHDGCEMFRFVDGGQYRYFAKCGKSKTLSTDRTESCGKGCTRHVTETTIQSDH